MIVNFRHRGLRRLYQFDDVRGVRQDQLNRIRRALAILDSAATIADVDRYPGMKLHPLKGELTGYWSIAVSGNWRIVFRFADGKASDVDLIDYH